jgi:2-polyprenyl-3-methyl-5-hydroxy-6-metoxy-1,4-benzoquinol methylase
MSTTDQPAGDTDKQRDAFMERLLQSVYGVFDVFGIYLGDRLGFYQVLADGGALTSGELAARTGTHERYAQEWLEQQTVVGVLTVDNADDAAPARRFRLPPGHVEPLVARDSLNYMAPLARLLAGAVRPLDALLEAYRSGGGVPYEDYGADLREGQAAINRPAFLYQLGQEWLPALPDVHARLLADPPARVADIGCGAGWSSIGMAQVYPNIQVHGYDLDEASVALAQANVQAAGLSDRVRMQLHDASDPALTGHYDLVTAFECVHDMSDPVAALRTMRRLAGEDGVVLIVDERVGDTFTPQGNDVEWMMYGWSILHCLPVGMADQPSTGTGTVMRADTLRRYAQEAGFREVAVLPIENFFFQFYRLTP